MKTMNPNFGKSGQPMQRLEDDRLLRGQGRFVDNLSFTKQSYLYMLYAPIWAMRKLKIL